MFMNSYALWCLNLFSCQRDGPPAGVFWRILVLPESEYGTFFELLHHGINFLTLHLG